MKKKTAFMGLFLALSMILSYVESLIPFSFGIPGIKLGLANLVVVLMLYKIGAKEALCVSVLRIILTGFLFGNGFSILYSLAGGVLSFLGMVLLKKFDFKCITISTTGGILHNIGQVIMASIVVSNYYIYYYIPVLLIAGAATGFINGLISQEIIIRIGKRFPKGGK